MKKKFMKIELMAGTAIMLTFAATTLAVVGCSWTALATAMVAALTTAALGAEAVKLLDR